MQQRMLTIALIQLRILGIILLLMIPLVFLVSFKSNRVYADIWQQLGLSKEKGVENIRASFMNGYFHYYGARNARNILLGDRAAIARDLLNYTKQYVESEGFKKQYDVERRQAKPEPDTKAIKTKEEIRKERIAETEKSIRQTEENMKTMKADMVKVLEPMLDMLKKTLKDYQDPNSQMIDLFYQGEVLQHEQRIKSYEERMKEWEKNYPEDYRVMVKDRLNKFLKLARTVDFNAELKTVNGLKKFVRADYEGKSYDWKQIFRAGKEVIVPAMEFAEQWVKEMK